MKMTRNAVFLVLAPALAVAHATPSHLEFEVASIRPAASADTQVVNIGMHIDGAQVRLNFLSLRECMRIAWDVKEYQIVGPEWTASERFDIAARLPAGASPDQVREMLRKLLTDRFRMTFHRDKKEFPVYALVVGRGGVKLKESAPDTDNDGTGSAPKQGLNVNATGSAAGVFVNLGQGAHYSFAGGKLVGYKMPMSRIADALAAYMDKPVVDMTGLTGNYDFTLEISPEDSRVMQIRAALRHGVSLPAEAARLADGSTESLYSAIEATGLKLDSRKAPQDVMVIDHADKTPTEN
jgi:uncharacterized protein (TIGR03435 family)